MYGECTGAIDVSLPPVRPASTAFDGATVAISSQAVSMSVAETRTHYTHIDGNEAAKGQKPSTFGGPRSLTGGWTSRIKRRMFLTVRQLDLSPIKNSPDPLALIVFKFPKNVRTNRDMATKAMERLVAALKYRLGKMRAYPLIWNFEFHWDENVHFNFLLAFPSSSVAWLIKKWAKIAAHGADASDSEVLHVTRFSDFDDDGNELSFEDKFYNATAYMCGLGDLLGFVKAHQYDVPEDWSPPGVGSGRMWGARGLRRAIVATYPVENLAQKSAIEAYMSPHCKQKLVQYWNPVTNELTTFNDGAFSPSRRAGSIQCLAVTEKMHEDILDLLELHSSAEVHVDAPPHSSAAAVEQDGFFVYDYAEPANFRLLAAQARRRMAPAFWERDGFDVDSFIASMDASDGAP